MNENERDNLMVLLNKYKIDKDKYINCVSNINFYNRDNVINDNILDLICPICYNILKNPKFCSSKKNSHSFCKECIEKFLEEDNKCPICKNIFENKSKKKYEKILHNLDFKCFFYNQGCTKIVNYLDYFKHINECEYKNLLYKCQVEKYNFYKKEFEKCNYIGNNKEIKKHFKKCGFTKYQCLFCNENILQINLKTHVGNKCIFGIFKNSMNDKYIGENNNRIKEGYGIYYFSDGNKYEGEWKNDEKEGYGIYYYSNGDKYEGEFKNGKFEGYGIYYFSDGNKYEGEWKNDKFEGSGIIYFSGGNKYQGEWENNEKSGYGIYYYSNGDKYEGEFKNDLKDGYGIYYFSNGEIYEGMEK